MFYFLFPLLFGFGCNLGSAFTAAFSRRLGERGGSALSAILRDLLGIPVWIIGFVLAILTPSWLLFDPAVVLSIIGWVLAATGGIIILVALATLRSRSFRPTLQDDLAQTGIYARVRHPIHIGTLLEFAGLFLIAPTLPVLAACALGVGWIFLQTHFEEIDLMERMPGYEEYMRRVPRFLPRLPRRGLKEFH